MAKKISRDLDTVQDSEKTKKVYPLKDSGDQYNSDSAPTMFCGSVRKDTVGASEELYGAS